MSSPYKTVALHTFGCKANFADSSLLNNKFAEIGYDVVPFDTIADIYVINTCSVTDKANIRVAAVSAWAATQLNQEDSYPFCRGSLELVEVGSVQNYVSDTNNFLNSVIVDADKI